MKSLIKAWLFPCFIVVVVTSCSFESATGHKVVGPLLPATGQDVQMRKTRLVSTKAQDCGAPAITAADAPLYLCGYAGDSGSVSWSDSTDIGDPMAYTQPEVEANSASIPISFDPDGSYSGPSAQPESATISIPNTLVAGVYFIVVDDTIFATFAKKRDGRLEPSNPRPEFKAEGRKRMQDTSVAGICSKGVDDEVVVITVLNADGSNPPNPCSVNATPSPPPCWLIAAPPKYLNMIKGDVRLQQLLTVLSNRGIHPTIVTPSPPPGFLQGQTTAIYATQGDGSGYPPGTVLINDATISNSGNINETLFHELDHGYYTSGGPNMTSLIPGDAPNGVSEVQVNLDGRNITFQYDLTKTYNSGYFEHMVIHDDIISAYNDDGENSFREMFDIMVPHGDAFFDLTKLIAAYEHRTLNPSWIPAPPPLGEPCK